MQYIEAAILVNQAVIFVILGWFYYMIRKNKLVGWILKRRNLPQYRRQETAEEPQSTDALDELSSQLGIDKSQILSLAKKYAPLLGLSSTNESASQIMEAPSINPLGMIMQKILTGKFSQADIVSAAPLLMNLLKSGGNSQSESLNTSRW